VARRRSPAHRRRPAHQAWCPVHVTLRARAGLRSLRSEVAYGALLRSFGRASKSWFRVIHFSVQTDHVHLIVEADGDVPLIRGVQGLAVRCAKAVNRDLGRKGGVWEHRYHARELGTPREVRAGLEYVLLNFRKHLGGTGIDPRSSGCWFDGWVGPSSRSAPSPLATPRTWLVTIGWRRAGPALDPIRGGPRGRSPPTR
jgi:REP element-mobilizing transposase RayT